MKSTNDDILRQWAQHNPFERASVDLIRKAQIAAREQRKQKPKGEPAPF